MPLEYIIAIPKEIILNSKEYKEDLEFVPEILSATFRNEREKRFGRNKKIRIEATWTAAATITTTTKKQDREKEIALEKLKLNHRLELTRIF